MSTTSTTSTTTKVDLNRLPFIKTILPPEREVEKGYRFGTYVEKGVELTEEKLKEVEDKMKDRIALYTLYPDLWADELLIPVTSSFKWAVYQRVQLRQQARVPLIHITGARGLSKTFIGVFGFVHRAVFYPGSSLAITAPSKTQAAGIARQTFNDILSRFPPLTNELDGNPVGTKDSYIIRFKNGSKIEVTAALETTRGRRFDAILVDESRDQIGDLVNGILVPTVSKIRLTMGAGKLNPREPQQLQWYYSSASSKSSYNYEKVIDIFIKMLINPNTAFAAGLDYRVPVIEGIYPASFVRDIRSDSTMNEQLFAREYLSHFTAENDDSWFNFKKLNSHRKIINAQWEARPSDKKNDKTYFIISVKNVAA